MKKILKIEEQLAVAESLNLVKEGLLVFLVTAFLIVLF